MNLAREEPQPRIPSPATGRSAASEHELSGSQAIPSGEDGKGGRTERGASGAGALHSECPPRLTLPVAGGEVQFRNATRDDAPALAAFAAAAFVETFGHLYPPADLAAYLEATYRDDIQAEEIGDAQNHCLLAHRGEELVGYCMSGPVDMKVDHTPNDRELYRLYVERGVQGAGVAPALMRGTLAWAKARNAEALYLSVWESNHRAQHFYRRYGFQHIGEHGFMVGSVRDRDFIWRLER